MATPIKAVPILSGELADEFVRRAEENEKRPHRKSTQEQRDMVAKFERQLREYQPAWAK